ncbi:type II toxin-antitoxin system VapC family toxin [Candidatus Uhrbacteria bacterium]|nr:type II toxin-antitoxin system VapC family toxin [Candidatus Uhrbacteria bacterium]
MGKAIALDTCIFIYHLEKNHVYLEKTRRIFRDIEAGVSSGIFSSIGLLELLAGPKQMGRKHLALEYKELLKEFPNLLLADISEDVIDVASDFRAAYKILIPDAIHLATAYVNDASYFLTNDRNLKKIKEVRVELL